MAAPLVTVLLLQPTAGSRVAGFVLFLAAALSDLWDGYLARSRDQVTSFGKIVDPIADKLLLVATVIPLYVLMSRELALAGLPVFGAIPLWAVVVLLGRELIVTVLRFFAASRGDVVAAKTLGKRKAVAQNVFIGAAILWVAFRSPEFAAPVVAEPNWFSSFHGWFTTSVLAIALVLTIVSLIVYLGTFTRILAREHP